MHRGNTTILVVDDDEDDRYFLRQAIERAVTGTIILEAQNGEEALTLLRIHPIQLIILDMNMPRLNGLETLTCIRSLKRSSPIPVVMISTSAQPDLMTSAYRKGINAYIKKPLQLGDYDQIANALKICFLTTS